MMRSFLLSSALSFALPFALVACGGASESTPSNPSPGSGNEPAKEKDPASSGQTGTGSGSSTTTPGGTVTNECGNAETVIVKSGETITRPTGSVMRLQLVYQGSSIGVREVRGVDMIISPSNGPLTPGQHSGYWATVADSSGTVTFTRLIRNPTILEAPASPGGGDFENSTVPQCTAKTILLDVPSGGASTIVVYGSPYGTFDGAVELARFSVK